MKQGSAVPLLQQAAAGNHLFICIGPDPAQTNTNYSKALQTSTCCGHGRDISVVVLRRSSQAGASTRVMEVA